MQPVFILIHNVHIKQIQMFLYILEVDGVTASSADINGAPDCGNPQCSPVKGDDEEATTMAMVATTTAASKRRRQAIEDILKAKIV